MTKTEALEVLDTVEYQLGQEKPKRSVVMPLLDSLRKRPPNSHCVTQAAINHLNAICPDPCG